MTDSARGRRCWCCTERPPRGWSGSRCLAASPSKTRCSRSTSPGTENRRPPPTPPDWALELGEFLDSLGIKRAALLGHPSRGWTALELAKAGRATRVLALAPAGLWRRRSPLLADAIPWMNWHLGRLVEEPGIRSLDSANLRSLLLRGVSARPSEVPAAVAIENSRAAINTEDFPLHFSQNRRLRFEAVCRRWRSRSGSSGGSTID